MLDPAALALLEPGAYRFCPEAQCRTVYFDPVSGTVFDTAQVRVPVWEKEPAGSRTICYCFGENEADIKREIEESGSSRAPQRIRAQIQAGRCECAVRNPSGNCCLRDVVETVRVHEQASTPRE